MFYFAFMLFVLQRYDNFLTYTNFDTFKFKNLTSFN